MGSSRPEPQEIKLEAPEQKIFQSFVPPEDFEYLDDLVKKYEGRSKELEKYLGATRQIDKEREARTAASYFSSLPSKELDYTSGLGQSINALNDVNYFRQDLKPGKQTVNRFAGERPADKYKPVREKETAPAVRDIAAQFANRRADEAGFRKPEETAQFVTPEIVAPEITDEITDETTPDPYTEDKDPKDVNTIERESGYVPPPPEPPEKPYAPGGRWSGGLDYTKAWQNYQKDFDEWNEKYGENPDGPINRTGYIPLHKLSDRFGI